MKRAHKISQKKVTLMLPEELLEAALRASGENMTATVRQGLQLIAASESYSKLLSLKGKLKLDLDLVELRRDRSW